MSKFLFALLLSAAAACLTVAGSAPAQEKKDAKKDAKEAKSAGATVELNNTGKDGKYRFNIRDAEGKLLASSPVSGYETKEAAMKAIETLRAALPTAKVTEKKAADKSDK